MKQLLRMFCLTTILFSTTHPPYVVAEEFHRSYRFYRNELAFKHKFDQFKNSFYCFHVTRKSASPKPEDFKYCRFPDQEVSPECVLLNPMNLDKYAPILWLGYNIKKNSIYKDNKSGMINYPKDIYNAIYYAVLVPETPPIKPGKYENESITVSVSTESVNLLNYLVDPTYCQTDTDCSQRYYMCGISTVNNFEHYLQAYGCEDDESDENNTRTMALQTDSRKSDNKQDIRIKCIKNHCTLDKS